MRIYKRDMRIEDMRIYKRDLRGARWALVYGARRGEDGKMLAASRLPVTGNRTSWTSGRATGLAY